MSATKTGRPPKHFFVVNGQTMTIKQMAELAGCTPCAMQARVLRSGMTPEDAIKRGAASRERINTVHSDAKRFNYRGQMLTINQLAKMVGVKYVTMADRLRSGDAERAVAMGAALSRADRCALKPKPQKPAKSAKAKPAPRSPHRAAVVTPAAQAAGWGSNSLPAPKLAAATHADTRKPDPSAEPIITAKTRRTVAPVFEDTRFTVDPATVTPLFGAMGFGRYLHSDSAVAKAYGAKAP